jgi:hypothetical protein
MICEKKNDLLKLYFAEGSETELADLREHMNHCSICQNYYGTLKQTMCKIDKLEDEEPPQYILTKIINEVTTSVPKPAKKKNAALTSILQIALGQIFIFAVIYILNSKIEISELWSVIKSYWLFQLIGSVGITIFIVFIAGVLVTLAMAPILLFESEKRKQF